MTVTGILSSPSQKRTFLLTSSMVLFICIIGIFMIAWLAPSTPIWNSLSSLFISSVASGVFALVAGLYIYYFFVDPNDIAAKTTILPQDIKQTLHVIALRAKDYKIFVRTGRHFRAEILPVLVNRACQTRCPIRVEVVLLDLRDKDLCEKYANFRKVSSFDRQAWNTSYVQTQILATILALIHASREHSELVNIHLFLSKRLSVFRIEGSTDEILVTREDPKDTASRYSHNHRDFGAYVTEFSWVRDEAFRVLNNEAGIGRTILPELFGKNQEIMGLEVEAKKACSESSPYVR